MENHIDHPLTLTVEQAAKLLGIGRSTAYELVHTGDIPSLRLGRRILVPRCQLAKRLGLDGPGLGELVMATEDSTSSPDVDQACTSDHTSRLAADQARLF